MDKILAASKNKRNGPKKLLYLICVFTIFLKNLKKKHKNTSHVKLMIELKFGKKYFDKQKLNEQISPGDEFLQHQGEI